MNSLDDLHEYLRLSYPRLKPPSYFCDNENEYGLILHYRTKRNFLLWYTVGQILKVAKLFYSTDVEIELLSENQEINEYHFILQLHFDNRVYLERLRNIGEYQHRNVSRMSARDSPVCMNFCPHISRTFSPALSSSGSITSLTQYHSLNNSLEHMNLSPITLEAFMDIFPFSIVYDSNMKIIQIGNCLRVRNYLFTSKKN